VLLIGCCGIGRLRELLWLLVLLLELSVGFFGVVDEEFFALLARPCSKFDIFRFSGSLKSD
jgi:hypothetical protein